MIGNQAENKILAKLQTNGRLKGGANESRHQASLDNERCYSLSEVFESVGIATGLPPALLAAISSRESACGEGLDENGIGDNGHAFGIMQIDRRYSQSIDGYPDPKSRAHILQAANKIKSFLFAVTKRHPDWSAEWQLRGAVAAYNFGVFNVDSQIGIDTGTTGGDYSSDVWERARYYADL